MAFKKTGNAEADYSIVAVYKSCLHLRNEWFESWENAVASFRHSARNLHTAGIANYRNFIDETLGNPEVMSGFKDELRKQSLADSLYKDYRANTEVGYDQQ